MSGLADEGIRGALATHTHTHAHTHTAPILSAFVLLIVLSVCVCVFVNHVIHLLTTNVDCACHLPNKLQWMHTLTNTHVHPTYKHVTSCHDNRGMAGPAVSGLAEPHSTGGRSFVRLFVSSFCLFISSFVGSDRKPKSDCVSLKGVHIYTYIYINIY